MPRRSRRAERAGPLPFVCRARRSSWVALPRRSGAAHDGRHHGDLQRGTGVPVHARSPCARTVSRLRQTAPLSPIAARPSRLAGRYEDELATTARHALVGDVRAGAVSYTHLTLP